MAKRGTNFSKDELETLYKVITGHKELDMQDVNNMSREMNDEGHWTRGVFSAKLGLARMHVLVHGVAPHGATERTAENWMAPSGPMDRFAREKGLDVDQNVMRAKRELKGRKPKLKREDAKQLMAQAAKQLSPERRMQLRPHVEQILGDIQAGLTPKEAFERVA